MRKGTPMVAQPEDPLVAQLGRGLAAALRQKGGSVLIRLAPDALGQLRVHLTLDKSQVSARIEASNAEAHDLLAKSESALRASLESRGLEVKSVEIVNIGSPERAANHDHQSDQNGGRDAGQSGLDSPGGGRPEHGTQGNDRQPRGAQVGDNAPGQTPEIPDWNSQGDAWSGSGSLRVDMTA